MRHFCSIFLVLSVWFLLGFCAIFLSVYLFLSLFGVLWNRMLFHCVVCVLLFIIIFYYKRMTSLFSLYV